MYCGEDIYTFESLQQYIEEASLHVDMNTFVWALVGNKADLDFPEVEKERIEAHCNRLQTNLSYSVSAKTGENISEAFDNLIVAIHDKRRPRAQTSVNIGYVSRNNSKQRSCC